MLVSKVLTELNKIVTELNASSESNARFRANSYSKVINIIESKMSIDDLMTKSSIDKLPITDYMKTKLTEIINLPETHKTKSVVNKSDKSDKIKEKNHNLIIQLAEIHGLGAERAKALVAQGLTSINELKSKKFFDGLPEETKLFLKLKPANKIKYENIKKLEPTLLSLNNSEMKLVLVGSYRRQKPTSSDIDVMLISKNVDIIDKFLLQITSLLDGKVYAYSRGKEKISLIIDVSDIIGERAVYKLDVFRVEPKEEIPMKLYSTGSKEFNISMRSQAKKKGYLLNQRGLYKDNEQIPGLNTEEDYFKKLDMNYLEPNKRL